MNPILLLLGCLALFVGLVFGLGLPLVAGWRLTAPEKIGAGAAVGVVVLYLFAMADYWLQLPAAADFLPPLAAVGLLTVRRRACVGLLRDPDARRLLGAWLLVAAWSLGLLALVRNYSGGGWALDWADHYSRVLLFLHHQPAHTALFGGDRLPTRPPLANAVTAVFLGLTGDAFPYFQIISTLLSSLAFLPVWLFAGRFGSKTPWALAVLTVLFMLNPSVMENSTFAWTKLPTVFLVLTGLYCFLPALAAGSRRRLAAAFFFLAAGMLAHYSAGPYIVAVVAAYFWWRRTRWRRAAFWRDTALCALPAALLLATWFGWSLREFGPAGTFLSNTSVTESTVHSWGGFVHEKSLNLVDTLVPPFARAVDAGFIAQPGWAGYLRDYFFLLYQANLVWMFGSVGGLTLLWLLWRGWRQARSAGARSLRRFWLWFIVCTTVLGTAAYGGVAPWGVAHLCLQGLLGLGLALLAARLAATPRWWHFVFAAGLLADFALGVGLQFSLEHRALPALQMVRAEAAAPAGHSPAVGGAGAASFQHLDYRAANTAQWGNWINLWNKVRLGYDFVGDWPLPLPLLVGFLGGVLTLAVYRCFAPSRGTAVAAATAAAP